MRRLAFVVSVLIFTFPILAAEEKLRIDGIAYTEGEAQEIQIQVWALGEQVADHREWQFEPVATGTASPGKPFSVELGDAHLPVVVELTAKGHVAVGLEVILDEQMLLPVAWLRRGTPLTLRVTRGSKAAVDAVVWGRIVPDRSTFDPWRWKTVTPRSVVPASGSLTAIFPETASWVSVRGLTRELEFGIEETRDVRPGSTIRLALDTIPARVRVFDRRGRPASDVDVIEVSSPAAVAAATDADGNAEIQIPSTGQWVLTALSDNELARAVGSSAPDGEIELQLGDRQEKVISWPEEADPVVLQLTGHSPLVGGTPEIFLGGAARVPVVAAGWIGLRSWGPKTGFADLRIEDPLEPAELEIRAPARIDGRVSAPEGVTVEGLPIFVRLTPDWMLRRNGMSAFRPDISLRRQWLPWAVTGKSGGFSLPDLPPGAYELETRTPGFPAAVSGRVFAKDGAVLEVDLALAAGAPFSLTAVDPEGVSIEGVAVDVFRAPPASAGGRRFMARDSDEPDARGATDFEGQVTLASVPVGPVRLALNRQGYVATTRADIEVPPGGLDYGIVTMTRGVTVRGFTVGPDGEPVPGAEVAMSPGPEDAWFRASTTSDDEGRFSLPDLDPVNEIYLRAQAEGLVPEPPLKVELPPEGEIEVRMAAERVIEGVVLGTEDEVPIGGAEIWASIEAMVGGMNRRVGTGKPVTSGEDGSFRIGGLREGRAELRVTATGRRELEQTVQIPADADPEPVVARLEQGLELRGRVETEAGEPAPGLEVLAMGSSRRLAGGTVLMESSQTRTGQDGSFHFDDLGPGDYRLSATSNNGSSAEASVTAGQDEVVVLRLEAGEAVSGTVTAEDGSPIAGAAVRVFAGGFRGPPPTVESDADGRFRVENVQPGEVTVSVEAEGFVSEREKTEVASGSGAQVQIRLARGGTVVGVVRGLSASELEMTHINSDEGGGTRPAGDGTFELKGVEPGEREIFARTRSSGRTKSVRTTVTLGGANQEVVIDFSGGLTVSGQVLRGGKPVPGMAVSATRTGEYARTGTISDSNGAYRIEGLDSGEYEIAARSRGNEVLAGDHVLLEVDSEIDLRIAGGRLEGRVLEAESGNPVEGATVHVKSIGLPDVSRSVQTDGSGEFVMGDLLDGEFRVSAEARGMSPAQELITISESSPSQVTLKVDPEEATVFVVREPDGSPARNVLFLTHQGRVQGPSAYATCDQDGRCEIGDVPPGVWTVLLRGDGAALLQVSFPAGEVPVQMKPRGQLKVIPPPSDGGAAWRARVTEAASDLIAPSIDWRNPGLGEWLPVAAPGLSLYVPEGLYLVEIYAPDGSTSVREAVVPGGGEAEVVLGE